MSFSTGEGFKAGQKLRPHEKAGSHGNDCQGESC